MPSNFFGHLKRALELFISIRMIPLATFYAHLVDTMTPGKKKKKKKKKIKKKKKKINTHP